MIFGVLGVFDSVGSFFWPGNDDEEVINGNLTEGSGTSSITPWPTMKSGITYPRPIQV